ncbi:hypothetical protein QDY65_01175 [Pyrococcus kukulkanii]|uniref:hypothetical protein n=1 Tax=Pyrococcus kukulkanii TaxID=1609559 RepID=UPI003568B267
MRKILSLIIGILILGLTSGVSSAAEPETKAAPSSPYYWNGHFVGKVGIASTYLPKAVAVNEDDTVTLPQVFFLRVKLGDSWKYRWNHYYFPTSSGHWISIEIIKPSPNTYVGIVGGKDGIFIVDSGHNTAGLEDKYKGFFKKAIDLLADILGLPSFSDIISSLGESERGSYTIQISWNDQKSFFDVKKITIKFYGTSTFRGTDYGAGLTWIITNPKEGDYKFKVSGGATLYVTKYSHNSIPTPIILGRNHVIPYSVLGETTRSASITVKTRIYYSQSY